MRRTLGFMTSTHRYSHGHHESVLRSHRWRTATNSAAYLLSCLHPGDRLLDVGCGPGTITVDFATRLVDGEVLGVDNAPEALRSSRALAAERHLRNVVFEEADISQLPFPDDSFDVVHAHQVLQHVADPVAALIEMRRVCRPGGIVAARDSDYPGKTWFPEDPRLDRWLALYIDLARRNQGEPAAGRRLLSWAQTAGFSEIMPSASVWCFATGAERTWWGTLWADRVTASAFATQALESGFSTQEELGEIADAWRSWANALDGWYAVLHGEILCTP
jgi:ubiquinone/menaquinone biosynthesis C-methylase UbiE